MFEFFIVTYEGELDFNKITICVKPERMYYNIQNFACLRRYLITKIDDFERQGIQAN